jgi:hypothetical protein
MVAATRERKLSKTTTHYGSSTSTGEIDNPEAVTKS